MSCNSEIKKNDIGTLIKVVVQDCRPEITEVMDLSLSTFEFIFRKPDYTTLIVVPVFTTDGTDGALQYTTILGDFDQAGEYSFQALVRTPLGTWTTETMSFTVYNTIKEVP